MEAQDLAKQRCLPNKTFQRIHDNVLKELELTVQGFKVLFITIRLHIYQKFNRKQKGVESPTAEFESIIIMFAK